MNVNISIDGVLRNTIGKFEYHYVDYYMESDTEVDESFDYQVSRPICSDDIKKHFKFQSVEEFEHFLFLEFPLEIFGHAFTSYSNVFLDLNKLIHENKNVNFSVVGLNERGRAKPASLFFLSKNNFLGDNVKFITSKDLKKEWENCDLWITDNEEIIKARPRCKKVVIFNTEYNKYMYGKHIHKKPTINELKQIDELCLISSEKIIFSTLMRLLKLVKLNTKTTNKEKEKGTPKK